MYLYVFIQSVQVSLSLSLFSSTDIVCGVAWCEGSDKFYYSETAFIGHPGIKARHPGLK